MSNRRLILGCIVTAFALLLANGDEESGVASSGSVVLAGAQKPKDVGSKTAASPPEAKIVAGDNLKSLKGAIEIDGSSTVYLVSEAAAEAFKDATKGGVNVTVGSAGTGGGFNRFCKGELDVADASRPISGKERDAAKANKIEYIELPVAFDALTVAVHPTTNSTPSPLPNLRRFGSPMPRAKSPSGIRSTRPGPTIS